MSNMGFTALHFKLPAKQKATAQCLSLQVATKFTAIFTQERSQKPSINLQPCILQLSKDLYLTWLFVVLNLSFRFLKVYGFELNYSSAKVEKAMAWCMLHLMNKHSDMRSISRSHSKVTVEHFTTFQRQWDALELMIQASRVFCKDLQIYKEAGRPMIQHPLK